MKIEEDNLIAKCVYNSTDSKSIDIINIYVLKDYTIYADWDGIKFGMTGDTGYSMTYSLVVNLIYDDFKSTEGETTCEVLNKIYLDIESGMNPNTRQGSTTYFVEKKEPDSGYPYELNKTVSKIYYQNYDEESNLTNNWIATCHYGDLYLSFNKESYEKNFPTGNQDILEVVLENNYSCPASLCSSTTCARGFCSTTYTLKNEYDKSCVISMNYTEKYRCGSLSMYIKEYDRINKLLETEKNVNDINLLNKIMNQTKTFCSSIMKNLNYNDSNNCVQECLEINGIFAKDQNIVDGHCGFSGKLISWIANIIKWGKYLVPVIVIVLGILDFIKAIAADKEDEMKKAQGRFVKRLIAAALIFIVPFIIEFILDKLGFDAFGCGIIDL
ncbi:MAG: hypothetical protein E7174_01315 [Firmicutes bacterium]|nr:hypothetical protein [Bacillota bacterium]